MSDKISYVLEVLDGYSAITKNLKKELSEIQELTKFKFNSSDFKGLAQLSKEYDKIAKSAERIKKAKTGFTLIGESFSSSKINAAALRANRAGVHSRGTIEEVMRNDRGEEQGAAPGEGTTRGGQGRGNRGAQPRLLARLAALVWVGCWQQRNLDCLYRQLFLRCSATHH
jgi:hypothetical protein